MKGGWVMRERGGVVGSGRTFFVLRRRRTGKTGEKTEWTSTSDLVALWLGGMDFLRILRAFGWLVDRPGWLARRCSI
jgi:hypothetical protein